MTVVCNTSPANGSARTVCRRGSKADTNPGGPASTEAQGCPRPVLEDRGVARVNGAGGRLRLPELQDNLTKSPAHILATCEEARV